jgi:hypothetical protein
MGCLINLTILISSNGHKIVHFQKFIGCLWCNRAVKNISKIERLPYTALLGIFNNGL